MVESSVAACILACKHRHGTRNKKEPHNKQVKTINEAMGTLGRRFTNRQLKVRDSCAASRAASLAKFLRVFAANHAAVVAKLAINSTASGVKQPSAMAAPGSGVVKAAASTRHAWCFSKSTRLAF